MRLTVREFQTWIQENYPEEHQFPSELRYWINKYVAETLEAKRLSHQRFKDIISQVVIDDE